MPASTSRKSASFPRGEVCVLNLRFRESHEPDLFALIMSLANGTAAGFIRSALDQALRSGALTKRGYVLAADEIQRSLQIQLRMAKEDNAAQAERIKLLEADLRDLSRQPRSQSSDTATAVVTPPSVANPQALCKRVGYDFEPAAAVPSEFAGAFRHIQYR